VTTRSNKLAKNEHIPKDKGSENYLDKYRISDKETIANEIAGIIENKNNQQTHPTYHTQGWAWNPTSAQRGKRRGKEGERY